MLSNAEFYVNYNDYSVMIDSMREKLLEAIKRDKNRDYSKQWETIETLQRLQALFHLMYHNQQTIENDSGKVMIERKKLLDKNGALERENANLKQELINRISGIEDVDFLNAIKTILDYNRKEPFIELTKDQELELLIASKDGEKGNFKSQSEMDKKVEENSKRLGG